MAGLTSDGALVADEIRTMPPKIAMALMLTSSLASAEPSAYVETDAKLGGWSGVGYGAMLAVDGGTRLTDVLWTHLELAYGRGGFDEATGSVAQIRLGAEARSCTTSGTWCGIAGMDLGGYRAITMTEGEMSNGTLTALVAVPRVGLDIGSSNIRFRIGLELEVALLDHDAWAGEATRSALIDGLGIATSAGIAYQWR